MRISLLGGYVLSVVLNKGPYSTCLNPHIGIIRPQLGGYMLRFPRHWIFDVETSRAKRRWHREQRRKLVETKLMFGFPRSGDLRRDMLWRVVAIFDTGDGETRTRSVYLRVPHYRTWVWRWSWRT